MHRAVKLKFQFSETLQRCPTPGRTPSIVASRIWQHSAANNNPPCYLAWGMSPQRELLYFGKFQVLNFRGDVCCYIEKQVDNEKYTLNNNHMSLIRGGTTRSRVVRFC